MEGARATLPPTPRDGRLVANIMYFARALRAAVLAQRAGALVTPGEDLPQPRRK